MHALAAAGRTSRAARPAIPTDVASVSGGATLLTHDLFTNNVLYAEAALDAARRAPPPCFPARAPLLQARMRPLSIRGACYCAHVVAQHRS